MPKIRTIPIGTIGTLNVSLPIVTVGSGPPRGTILAVQHGGEWSPLWVLKSFLERSKGLRGTATVIPVANPFGFAFGIRNEPIEGKDPNRQFPGKMDGDFSARLAAGIFEVCQGSDFVIDLHTFSRLTPMIVGYTRVKGQKIAGTDALVHALQPDAVWVIDDSRSEDARFRGSLDESLASVGIPSVFVEMPNYQRINESMIERIATGLRRAFEDFRQEGLAEVSVNEFTATYVFADDAGLFEPAVRPMDRVERGQVIGTTFTLPDFTAKPMLAPTAGTILTLRGRDVTRTGSKLASIGIPFGDRAGGGKGSMNSS